MSARGLVNLAYAALAEGEDEAGLEKLDATLEQADRAMDVFLAKRWKIRQTAAAPPTAAMSEAELFEMRKRRLLRSVPDQSRQLAASMAQFANTPGATR